MIKEALSHSVVLWATYDKRSLNYHTVLYCGPHMIKEALSHSVVLWATHDKGSLITQCCIVGHMINEALIITQCCIVGHI